jgi:vacuolar-type H+-ATPase subunit E/Vma4
MEELLLELIGREAEREKAEIEAGAKKKADSILADASARAVEIAASGPPVPPRQGGDKRWGENNASLADSCEEALKKIRNAALDKVSGLPRPERLRLLVSFWEGVRSELAEGDYLVKGPGEFSALAVSGGKVSFTFQEVEEERVAISSGDGSREVAWSLESVVESYFRANRGRLIALILEKKVA